MSAIHLDKVSKTYANGKTVIDSLQLEIRDRSFTVMVGPSGCGKTTALRLIAGLEEVTAGEIRIGERNVTKAEPGDRGIAMVFQNYAIYPHMTVRNNIEFGLKNQGLPKDEIKRRVEHVVNMVGLQDYMNAKPSMLSGGQRQRIALSRAISKNPEVFLMDEPLSNLDAKLRNQMRSELIQLHRNLQSTFVFVTHDQVEAMTMGTDIVIFNEGKVMQNGTPKQVYNDPDNVFVASFIGDPGMNIVPIPHICLLGFRPQRVKLMKPAQFRGIDLSGKIVLKETLGLETLYHVSTSLGRIVVKSEDDRDFDERVKLHVSEEDLFYFDEASHRRIRDKQQISSMLDSISYLEGVNVEIEHQVYSKAL